MVQRARDAVGRKGRGHAASGPPDAGSETSGVGVGPDGVGGPAAEEWMFAEEPRAGLGDSEPRAQEGGRAPGDRQVTRRRVAGLELPHPSRAPSRRRGDGGGGGREGGVAVWPARRRRVSD